MNKNRLFQYCLAVACFFAACHVSQKTRKQSLYMQLEFDKQGHRGCRGLMPENTIPAMLKALDLGVTTLEMDVVISKDKKVVLSHDPFFSRDISTLFPGTPQQANISGDDEHSYNIYGMNYSEIKRIDVGLKPHPRFANQHKMPAYKPLLTDLLDSVAAYVTTSKRPFPFLNIETKLSPATDGTFHPAPAEFVELLMQVINLKGVAERVIIQSFDFRTLQYLHEHFPAIKTAMLIEDSDKRSIDEQLKALGFTPTIYSPAYQLVNAAVIKQCHELRMRIIPWTINDAAKIQAYKSMGVDGIISDYPDLFN